ncbi:hypothetical protein FB567DRAFT_7303 [Paraphoma chrysanthemicola]|uniref:Uncharacterized protein n=1 Tax=Paraphoma chrysanthemicola TaxID=798071 RepID=A0A8K0RJN9_9PLEO|nr:hypothetical protein FB567DRAFT_7303 [Paraphoma chrysanthemicola]
MAPNDSRHLLPMSSLIFTSSPNLRNTTTLPTNPTLVNLNDAADMSVTALPDPLNAKAGRSDEKHGVKTEKKMGGNTKAKAGIFKKAVRKIKKAFKPRAKTTAKPNPEDVFEQRTLDRKHEPQEMQIGSPTNVRHVATGGPRGLREGMLGGDADAGEDEWEDIETKTSRRRDGEAAYVHNTGFGVFLHKYPDGGTGIGIGR